MSRGRLVRGALAMSVLAAVPQTPAQATPGAGEASFSAPRTVSERSVGPNPRVLLASDGEATVAWSGLANGGGNPPASEGVYIAERPPGATDFNPAQQVASGEVSARVELAQSARGDRVLAWFAQDPGAPRGPALMYVSIAPPGSAFGAPERVPVPPRAPPQVNPPSPDTRGFDWLSVDVAGDGSVVVGFRETDAGNLTRADVAVRRADGTWAEPQVLQDYTAPPSVAADGLGGLHVIWANERSSYPGEGTYVFASDAGPDGQFGPPQVISTPGRVAFDGNAVPSLHANSRGDLLAVWNSSPVPSTGSPVWIEVAERPAGGAWAPPHDLTDDGLRPSAAINDRGDATVTWTTFKSTNPSKKDHFSLVSSFRPAGGGFGAPGGDWYPTSGVDAQPITLDEDGTEVIAVNANGDAYNRQVLAVSRIRNARAFSEPAEVSPRGGRPYLGKPAVSVDRFGNGIVIWTGGFSVKARPLTAAAYSTRAPTVTAFRASSTAFTFRLNKPARVTLEVKRGHHSARQRKRVKQGLNELAFNKDVRSLLRSHGRLNATISARDAGPRRARPRTVTIKR